MKKYLYKIYDKTGQYLTTWTDVVSEPTFSQVLNGGYTELKVKLARSVFAFGEGQDVMYDNQLKLYVMDKETNEQGALIYTGYISLYNPSTEGKTEEIEVTFLSYWAQLGRELLESAGATEVAYNTDPSLILKDVLDKYSAGGGKLDYSGGSVDLTGTTAIYTFNTNTYAECLLKIIELAPAGWYIKIDPNNVVSMKAKPLTVQHMFTIGQDILAFRPEKRTESIVNKIYFTGLGIFRKFQTIGSINKYGVYAKKMVDTKVSDPDTANLMAQRVLNAFGDPETRVVVKIADSNGSEKGYDIESINVGDMCKIHNTSTKAENVWDALMFDVDSWDYELINAAALPLQIQKIEYHPDYAVLELSNRQPDISKRIEDINKSLVDSLTAGNPSTPS